MDNLNTHVGASLYKTFNPKEARRILDKLDSHLYADTWELVEHEKHLFKKLKNMTINWYKNI